MSAQLEMFHPLTEAELMTLNKNELREVIRAYKFLAQATHVPDFTVAVCEHNAIRNARACKTP